MNAGIGILGFAHGHVNMYCTQWQQHPEYGVQVTAGWDHDTNRLQKAAGDFGLEVCASVEALLARPDVQAVVIAAETAYHAELVEKAAAAGKAIVLQKPLALTLVEGERIVAAVNKAGVPFTLAWQMRVDPQNLKIKALIESGELGRILMVRRRHGLGTHTWANFNQSWHVNPALNRNIWADDASHAVDFIYWLLGAPATVTAEIDSLLDPSIPMDNGVAVFRYAGGPVAEITCSFTCVAAENTTEVIGENGTIIQNYGDVPSCNVPRPEGASGLKWFTTAKGDWTYSEIASPANHGARIGGLALPLAQFVRGERPPIATAEEGLMVLKLTLATLESSEAGRRVTIQ